MPLAALLSAGWNREGEQHHRLGLFRLVAGVYGINGRRCVGVKYLAGPSSLCGAASAAAPLHSPLFHPPWLLAWCCYGAPEIKSNRSLLLNKGETVVGRQLLNLATNRRHLKFKNTNPRGVKCAGMAYPEVTGV